MALSLVIYVVIGVVTRTSNPDQYYVAGRGVPAFYNGMATGSDWMSAASFISMGGRAVRPGLRRAGLRHGLDRRLPAAGRVPRPLPPPVRRLHDPRLPGRALRRDTPPASSGSSRPIACSFTYLIAQVTGVGLIVSRFIGLDFNVGVFVGLLGVLFCSVLGGMRSVTWTQVAQYIILIISYLVPVVYLSWTLFSIPIPELTYGQLLQQNNTKAIEITRDAKEKETRALWKKDADEAQRQDQGRRHLRGRGRQAEGGRRRWPAGRPPRRRPATTPRSAGISPCRPASACGTSWP